MVSTLATRSIEAIAAAGGPQWFQLYFQENREFNLRLIRRAEQAGHRAIMLTVDAPLPPLALAIMDPVPLMLPLKVVDSAFNDSVVLPVLVILCSV